MHIYIAADHRGHQYKLSLIDILRHDGYQVTDCWNTHYDPLDDHPRAAHAVVQAMKKDSKSIGVVICGSGVGVSISANKYPHIYCVLGFDVGQVEHARAWDHANVLALPAEYVDLEAAHSMVKAMIDTPLNTEEKMVRRVALVESLPKTIDSTSSLE